MSFQNDKITSIPAPLPTDYDRQYSFSDWERLNPGVPYPAAGFEAEFNAIEESIDETQARLRLIQRDDGALKNNSVGLDQLTTEAQVGVQTPADWQEFTAYTAGNSVIYNNVAWYVAAVSHNSSDDFVADLGAGNWVLLLDFSAFYTTESEHWANFPVDQLVPEGDLVDDYSALHHATKAGESAVTASDAAAAAVAAAATLNLPAPTEIDRILIGNGVDAFVWGPQFDILASSASVAQRDAYGRLRATDPVGFDDVANKNYVDTYRWLASLRNWQARSAPSADGWRTVTWSPELSLFVGVADSGTSPVMTSPDGTLWTAQTAPTGVWQCVTWSPTEGLFVAVGESGGSNTIMTSPDGINWTARTSPAATTWQSVCWSPELGLYVAVGSAGTNRVMYSVDGINWTAASAASADPWQSVCWSPGTGLFVAVATSGAQIMTSPDGINWTNRSAPSSSLWRFVTWSEELSLFVAVGTSGATRAMTSPDGITWTGRTMPTGEWLSVTWSAEAEYFVAVGQGSGAQVAISQDGINWEARTPSEAATWHFICWSPENLMFVAVSSSGTDRVMTSL